MTETLTRSSPKTGTVFPKGRPFWIVDGKAYDFTEWIGSHPAARPGSPKPRAATSAPCSTPITRASQAAEDPREVRDQRSRRAGRLARTHRSTGPPTADDILPKLGVPPFLLAPDFDARKDLPHLDFSTKKACSRRSAVSCTARSRGSSSRRYDRPSMG